MLDRIEFLLGEALTALRRNGMMTLAAITTSAVSLFLIGGLSYAYFRVQEYGQTLPGKFEMRVFLRSGVKEGEISRTAEAIRKMPDVATVTWIPRDLAWAKQKREHPDLTEGIENPLPDALKVKLKALTNADSVADNIRGLALVDPDGGVSYLKDEQRFADQSLQLIRWLGILFGSILLATAGILIYNAIRMAALSRRNEVRIMELVGASRAMIKAPFMIEGMVQGLLGGVVASFMILAAQRGLIQFLDSVKIQATLPAYPMLFMLGALSLAGGAYGLVCSTAALRRESA
ncbi:MAG: ABC transporter permease [Armatimonadetes bacterium]|nr:ABC transporter permease [Armatimonadota bacterium]